MNVFPGAIRDVERPSQMPARLVEKKDNIFALILFAGAVMLLRPAGEALGNTPADWRFFDGQGV